MSNDTQPEIRFPGFTEAWEQRKLGEVVESVGTGRSTFTNGIVQTSETPYAVLGSTSVISYDSMFDHSGDFILTARVGANAGNLYKYFGEVKISDNTVYIQANNLDFIYYLLTKYDLKRLSFGTGQPLVKASEVKNLKLNFPQKNEEQQKIGSFFKQLDDTIALHQRKLDLLKETKKGFLQKMFPKNGAKVPEIRFPGFTEDWEQRKFKEFSKKTGKKNTKDLDFPAYSVSNKAGLISQTEQFDGSRLDDLEKTNYKFVEPNEFAYNPARVNVGSIAFNNLGMTVIVSSLYVVVKMSEDLDNEFILQFIKSPTFIKEVKRNTEGSVREYLFYENFANIKFPFTRNKEEQQKIGNFFKQLDDTITLHQRKLDLLKETKKGFLQKMFV
ncbi:restriction endonuclease subunit S [Enterococcus faecium]|uniref:restriction endonuclease subunit S n=1 Tax=Enterococcus faecium TaxID=1352 RepID=UPI001E52000A|nr:restriction endonuclease subunit S [Enterococcus faecium]MCD5217618.1 restriction endonuclease subunit S [Enterococcus faecium]